MNFDILIKGGIIMVPIVGLSIYALAVIFYKIVQFNSSKALKNDYIEPVMQHVRQGEYTDADELLKKTVGPVARVMRCAIRCVLNRDMSIKSRESEIARIGTAEIQVLEAHMRGLEMVANTAPLLGLLGTVLGMITVFATLSNAGGRVEPALLAGGIWEALITTVGGLCVAIPTMAAYYVLDGNVEKVRIRMRDVAVQILALEDAFVRNEKEQERREVINQREAIEKEQAALKKLAEEQVKLMEQVRTAPQSSGTLKLLSPSYRG
jgi:biopolymer transport protein ExbB